MPLSGAYYVGNGNPVALSTLFSVGTFRQIDIFGNDGNAEAFYVGPSTVTAAGVDAIIAVGAGKAWGHRAGPGEQTTIDLANLYIVGTASDAVHISVIS